MTLKMALSVYAAYVYQVMLCDEIRICIKQFITYIWLILM